MLLAILDVDSVEGGGDFGAKVAAVESEDTRVVDDGSGLNVVDADGATHIGERYSCAAADGGIEIRVVLEDTCTAGCNATLERRSCGDGNHQT